MKILSKIIGCLSKRMTLSPLDKQAVAILLFVVKKKTLIKSMLPLLPDDDCGLATNP